MSLLPLDLQKLPPQALDVIRYLSTHGEQGTVEEIIAGTGLTARGFRKAIRRLVTRFYVDMPQQDFYVLTNHGREAADDLRAYDGDESSSAPVIVDEPALIEPEAAAVPPEPAEAPTPEAPPETRHARRLSVVVPRELVIRCAVTLRAGFDAPVPDHPVPLAAPGRVILRLSAPGCDVDPVERPIEVAVSAAAGPVSFHVTPRQEGPVRVRIEAYQLVAQGEIQPIGGMFFDLNAAGFPTPDSGEVKVLGAEMRLYPS